MFCLGAHQEVLRDYSWLGDPLSGGQRLNPGQLHAKQVYSPLYYFSNPYKLFQKEEIS